MSPKGFHWPSLGTLLPLIALLVWTGCGGRGDADTNGETATSGQTTKQKDDAKEAEEERVPVEAVALGRGAIESVLRFSTNLEAEKEVQVFSEASRQVVELKVEEGDRVRKGQLLIRLQDDEQRGRVRQTESQHAKALREFKRQQNLFEKELISEKALNDATFEVEQRRIDLENAKLQLSYTEVHAPISGTITNRLVNLGDHLTVNQHLFDLVDFNSIVARVFVPEREIARLRVGQDARIESESLSGGSRSGKVLRIAPIVDSRSGTVKTTVAIPPDQSLLPGMYVEVELVTDVRTDALLVPKRAVVYDNDQSFLFRLVQGDADNLTVERLRMAPQLEDRDFVQVSGDILDVGDRVVIAGQAGLKDGAKVKLLDPSAPGSNAAVDMASPAASQAAEEGE